jgi:hypothetical protein
MEQAHQSGRKEGQADYQYAEEAAARVRRTSQLREVRSAEAVSTSRITARVSRCCKRGQRSLRRLWVRSGHHSQTSPKGPDGRGIRRRR